MVPTFSSPVGQLPKDFRILERPCIDMRELDSSDVQKRLQSTLRLWVHSSKVLRVREVELRRVGLLRADLNRARWRQFLLAVVLAGFFPFLLHLVSSIWFAHFVHCGYASMSLPGQDNVSHTRGPQRLFLATDTLYSPNSPPCSLAVT